LTESVPPPKQMGVIGVHLRIGVAGRDLAQLDRRPRPPRIVRDVHALELVPIAVDGRDGHPLPVDEPGLHRELCPVTRKYRYRFRRVGRPTVGGAVLRRTEHLAERHACEIDPRRRVRPSTEPRLTDEEWRMMVSASETPLRPQWTEPFLVSSEIADELLVRS
jgi:hypothetical protein